MAREIVITSVPRGVKLGRTGFQVAMQTAGMREDLAAVLEKMAGYRHLGAGMNPVCYFHRIARTVAGQANVIGRIVDAGIDFSNRSNKLAHMLVIDPAEMGQVVQSSPAAALAAVEPQLATVWTAAPEERQAAFSLAGIPPSHAAPCAGWQQVMGDAGWAGVIAERALQNQPTLIVGTDPSPASCRRMLALFQEALAVVPPNRRWGITFDTTTLSADGVLWRGTYAGSPESQAMHPGLLVIDLARPQAIPANMAVGELVQAARTGQVPMTPAAPSAPTAPATPVTPRVPGVVTPAGRRQSPIVPPTVPGQGLAAPQVPGAPPPPGYDDEVEVGATGKRWSGGLIAAVIAAGVLVLLGLVGGGVYLAMNNREVAAKDNDKGRDQDREKKKKERDNQPRKEEEGQQPGKGKPDAGPPKQEKPDEGGSMQTPGDKDPNPEPEKPPDPPAPENLPTPDEAFAALQEKIKAFRDDKGRKPVWPPDPKTGLELFPLDQKFADVLDATLVLGKCSGFSVNPSRASTPNWKWDFKVGNDCLATLELTGGKMVMRRGDAPKEVWAKHEKLLRGMPIVFTRPGRPLSPDNAISAAGPAELQLPAGATLHDLLCGDGKTVDLVGPAGAAIETVVIKTGEIPAKDSQVQVKIVPVDKDKARLELTAQVGDRAYTLNEPIVVTTQTVGRELDAWTTRTTRFGNSTLSAIKPFTDRDMGAEIFGRDKNIPAVFKSLLEDGFPGRKFKLNKTVEEWTGEDKAVGAYTNKFKTFEKVREILCTYIAEKTEGNDTFAAAQTHRYEQEHPKPTNPGDNYTPPQRNPKEEDKAYEARNAAQKNEYERQKAAWEKWSEGLDQAILNAAKDSTQLRQFFDAHLAQMKPDDEVGPEMAAIQVLLGLDGLILAKCHRTEIEALLKRVPVAALVEGQAKLTWTIDGLADFPPMPARLAPADVLEKPAEAGTKEAQKAATTPGPDAAAGGGK